MYRDYDKYGMMLGDGKGQPDALWRTSLAYIAYPRDSRPLEGIRACIKQPTETNGILRHPESEEKNTSRDAIIMLMTALAINQPELACASAGMLPRRISDRYRHSPSSWAFIKMLQHNRTGRWLSFLSMLETIYPAIIVPILRKRGVVKNRIWLPKWFYRMTGLEFTSRYPDYYAIHLRQWMLYLAKDNLFKRAAEALIRRVWAGNQLVLALQRRETMDVPPRKGWQWQRLPWVQYTGIDLSVLDTNGEKYVMDIDIIHQIQKINDDRLCIYDPVGPLAPA